MRNKMIGVLLVVMLASCGIYKMDIRQGNLITPDMREKLRLGMTRQQVRFILGTPMIQDAFHLSRWDYVYRLEHQRKVIERHRLTLYFDGDSLTRIDDAEAPAATSDQKG